MANKAFQELSRVRTRPLLGHVDHKQDMVARLHQIEEQVRGLTEMIQAAQSCEDVAMQMSAARKALDTVFYRLMAGSVMNAACVARTEANIRVDVERSARLLDRFG